MSITLEQIAEAFANWAASEGILARATGDQVADLALAFGAGAAFGAGSFGATVTTSQEQR